MSHCPECKKSLAVKVEKGVRYFSEEYGQWFVRGESDGKAYCFTAGCPNRNQPVR